MDPKVPMYFLTISQFLELSKNCLIRIPKLGNSSIVPIRKGVVSTPYRALRTTLGRRHQKIAENRVFTVLGITVHDLNFAKSAEIVKNIGVSKFW